MKAAMIVLAIGFYPTGHWDSTRFPSLAECQEARPAEELKRRSWGQIVILTKCVAVNDDE